MPKTAWFALALIALTARGAAAPTEAPAPVDVVAHVLATTVMIEGNGIYGAGVLVDPAKGTVLTSYHVVEEMKDPRVTTRDGRKGRATLAAVDEKLDVALLDAPDIAEPETPAPPLADAVSLRPGEEVFAIGMPRKLPFTLSRGVVSYVDREMEGVTYLQLDMNINDGNSGGPVFTQRGEVVGIMSFILKRAQGLSFALPVSQAVKAFPQRLALGPEPH